MKQLLRKLVGITDTEAQRIGDLITGSAADQLARGTTRLSNEMEETERILRNRFSRRNLMKLATLSIGSAVIGAGANQFWTDAGGALRRWSGISPSLTSAVIRQMLDDLSRPSSLEDLLEATRMDGRQDDERAVTIALRFARREAVSDGDIDWLANVGTNLPRDVPPLLDYQMREFASQILNRQGSVQEGKELMRGWNAASALSRQNSANPEIGVGAQVRLRGFVSQCNLALSASNHDTIEDPEQWINKLAYHDFVSFFGAEMSVSDWDTDRFSFEFNGVALQKYGPNYVHAIYYLACPIINARNVDESVKSSIIDSIDRFYQSVREAGTCIETSWQHTASIAAYLDRQQLTAPRDHFLSLALGGTSGTARGEVLTSILERRRSNPNDMQIRALVLLLDTLRANGSASTALERAERLGLGTHLLNPNGHCAPSFMSQEVVLSNVKAEVADSKRLLRALIADNRSYESYLSRPQ